MVTLATITDQTVMVTARHAGQQILLDGNVAATSTTPEQELRFHGSGLVELGWGDWDKALVVDGVYDGGWFSGTDGVASVTDPLAPLVPTWYRARAYNAEGGWTDSDEVLVDGMPKGRFYLNHGPDLASVARCGWNPSAQVEAGRQVTLRRYVGDENPTPVHGRRLPYSRTGAFLLRPHEGDTPLDEWERIAEAGGPMVWRDPAGRIIHGVMSGWYADDSYGHQQQISFTFTRTQGTA